MSDVAGGAAAHLEAGLEQLREAQKLLSDLQLEIGFTGSRMLDTTVIWHKLETIDDRLHDAGSYLGA